MTKKLESCPFCGSDDMFFANSIAKYVCYSCHAHGPTCREGETPEDAWNRRTGR